MGLLENSLRQFGAGRSIVASKEGVILAGNATAEVAAEIGLPIKVVPTDGTELVVVQRTDLAADDPKARSLAIADNRAGELNLDWDANQLSAALDESIELTKLGFSEKEIARLITTEQEETTKVVRCPKCGTKFMQDGTIVEMGAINASSQ